MNGDLGHDSALKGYSGPGQPWIMRFTLARNMPLVQDWSLDLIPYSPALYHCATATPWKDVVTYVHFQMKAAQGIFSLKVFPHSSKVSHLDNIMKTMRSVCESLHLIGNKRDKKKTIAAWFAYKSATFVTLLQQWI